jgi:transketolase
MQRKEYLREKLAENSINILHKAYEVKAGHIGGSLSMSQFLLPIIYEFEIANPHQFHLLLSKGHGSLGLYSILHTLNITSRPYRDFCSNNDPFSLHGHTCSKGYARLVASTGSLGHGLPISLGFAYGLSLLGLQEPVICIMGDGELQEGTTWECLLHRKHLPSNLKILIDDNESIETKTDDVIKSVGALTEVIYCDVTSFNDIQMLVDSLRNPGAFIVVCKTIKNANIAGFENDPKWHAGIPNKSEFDKMRKSLSIRLE